MEGRAKGNLSPITYPRSKEGEPQRPSERLSAPCLPLPTQPTKEGRNMKRGSGTSVKDKPVVIVRKKAGKGSTASGPAQPAVPHPSPALQAAAPAPLPEPP